MEIPSLVGEQNPGLLRIQLGRISYPKICTSVSGSEKSVDDPVMDETRSLVHTMEARKAGN